jgi:hypothetical protein
MSSGTSHQPNVPAGTLIYEAPLADVDSVSTTILTAVVEYSNRDPDELTPFYEYMDPDALDALFMLNSDGTPSSAATFTFSFEGYRIDITADGQLLIHYLA